MGLCFTRSPEPRDDNQSNHPSPDSPNIKPIRERLIHHSQAEQIDLMSIHPKEVPNVPFKDIPISAQIFDVHDGDTVHFIILIGNTPVKLSMRLLGIDTPEIRGGHDHLPEEKIAATMARDRLVQLITTRMNSTLSPPIPSMSSDFSPTSTATIVASTHAELPIIATIIIRDWDKFGGRVLGEIMTHDGQSVADIMCSEGYGRSYFGEKKQPWTKEDLSSAPFYVM